VEATPITVNAWLSFSVKAKAQFKSSLSGDSSHTYARGGGVAPQQAPH
jgi:hypothetical protein